MESEIWSRGPHVPGPNELLCRDVTDWSHSAGSEPTLSETLEPYERKDYLWHGMVRTVYVLLYLYHG